MATLALDFAVFNVTSSCLTPHTHLGPDTVKSGEVKVKNMLNIMLTVSLKKQI